MPRFFPPLYCLRIEDYSAQWHLPYWYSLFRWFCFLIVALAMGYSAPRFGPVEVLTLLFALAGASFTEQLRWYKTPYILEKKWGFGFVQFSKRWVLDQNSKFICQRLRKKTYLQLETQKGLLTLDKAATEYESKLLLELARKTSSWLGLCFIVQEASY